MESLNNARENLVTAGEILKLSSIAPQDKKELYQSLKGTLNIKYRDLQNKDSRRLLKQLVDAKLGEMGKLKSIIKQEIREREKILRKRKRLRKSKRLDKRLRRKHVADNGNNY